MLTCGSQLLARELGVEGFCALVSVLRVLVAVLRKKICMLYVKAACKKLFSWLQQVGVTGSGSGFANGSRSRL